MKIRQLHINRFGHFNECDLDFRADGLHVICGPNEAGKTTLLEFLRGLLFDFPPRSPYDFGGQAEMAGLGILELQGGRVVELRRRKGNKNKVAIKLDGHPTDLDDSGWLRLLDHADRGLFESVFAFGLDQLSRGEASLEHESLRSALFGGSLGGINSPDKVVAELTRQADGLFKKGGSKPAINEHLADLKRLAKDIKDRLLRPARYLEIEAAATKAAADARRLHEDVDRVRREHSKIEKRIRAWPKWWALRQRREQRANLSIPDNVPADARQRYLAIVNQLKAIADEKGKRTEQVKQDELARAALKLDPVAVSHQAEIKSCLELRQSYVEAKQQLPERKQNREEIRRSIDRELEELRPGWTHDQLRDFRVDLATRGEIDRLTEERAKRADARIALVAKRDSDAENLERARNELVELGSPRDVESLSALLAEEADFVTNRKRRDDVDRELTKLEKRFATQRRKLTPPLDVAVLAPQELPVPRTETVADFKSRIAEVREQMSAAKASASGHEDEIRELTISLDAKLSTLVVPSFADRDGARKRRDSGWHLIRQQYILDQPAESQIANWLVEVAAVALPDGYERAVEAADNVADLIYDHAQEVADRESQRRLLVDAEKHLGQNREQIADLQEQLAALNAEWTTLWQPSGFEPLAPDAMLGWLGDRESLCAIVGQRDELMAERSQIDRCIESFEQRLRAGCDLAQDGIPALLVSAREAVDESRRRRHKATELRKEILRLEQQIAKYDLKLASTEKLETAAASQWQAVLNCLKLPSEWSTDVARTVIERLVATRNNLDKLPDVDDRITRMQARIDEFDERAGALCKVIEPELRQDPAELAIKKLEQSVQRAVDAQKEHGDLSQKIAEAKLALESLDKKQSAWEGERESLFLQTDSSSEPELLDVVSRVERAAQLDAETAQLARDIDLIRATDDAEEFEQALSTDELDILEGQLRDLTDEMKAKETLRRAADGDEALARNARCQLDGSREVAILTEELSQKRSLLAADVDRYMPLVYARHLLNVAVSRFEKENQPEMIATVSRLLGQMTDGKYVEFDRSGGGQHNILVRRSDGVERTPDQLSTGTREQLYLAIRLAYVQHYCKKSQPLPIVIDDVLVNFDDRRARQTLEVLAEIARSIQVLFFTCHNHMLEIAREVIPGLIPIRLPDVSESQLTSKNGAS